MFLQHLADQLSGAWGKRYGYVIMMIKVYLTFTVVQSTNLCFRGSCVHWQSGSSTDVGADLSHVSLAKVFIVMA